MERITLLLVVLFVYCTASYAQQSCGTDHVHDFYMQTSADRAHFSWMNETILEGILERRSAGGGSDEVKVIPTVVHVIHERCEYAFSDVQVDNGMVW